jgi:hypothetical protein
MFWIAVSNSSLQALFLAWAIMGTGYRVPGVGRKINGHPTPGTRDLPLLISELNYSGRNAIALR